jgi:drug/metabolite transporter (DMT)-like permease
MSLVNNGIVIASEVTLALYPILIKKVPTDLGTQLLARFLTYTVLGLTFASTADIEKSWGWTKGATRSILLGTLTLSHVATSYYAFQQLPAGAAMTLFYTYPIWNLVGAAFLYGEIPSVAQIGLIVAAFIGVALIAIGTEKTEKKQESEEKHIEWKGVISGIFAAVTETAMYFVVRGVSQPSALFSILELYPGALIGLFAYYMANAKIPDMSGEIWIPLLLFNAVVGFLGYSFRFYVIPRVTTMIFSLLSFFGVVASFLWGWLFVEEIPSWLTVLGASLIVGGATGIRYVP